MSELPFQGTIVQALYGAEAGSYAVPDWVDDMFTGMLGTWKRVYWNIHQESWPDRHSQKQTTIGVVRFQPYVWDACDCGGREIQHKPDCRLILEHYEWNNRRIDACRPHPNDPDVFRAAEVDFAALSGATPESQAWLDANPRPPCTCGEEDGWQERDCSEQCISRVPNFGIIGDVIQIRWYKYPGRGMSVTVPLTAEQWVDWRDRVTLELARAEHDHQLARYRAYEPASTICPVYYSSCQFCAQGDQEIP